MARINDSVNEGNPSLIEAGNTSTNVPLASSPTTVLPFLDMKSQYMRAKRAHATLRRSDAAPWSPEQGGFSPSAKRRRLHNSMSKSQAECPEDDVERDGDDVDTSACYDFPSSYSWRSQAEEDKSDLIIVPGDEIEVSPSAFRMNKAPLRESPPKNNIFEPSPSPGIYAQPSDTDEKPEDWPTNLLTESDSFRDHDNHSIARWLGRDEADSPFFHGDALSPTARSTTLESTFESCEAIIPINATAFNHDSTPQPHVAPPSSNLGATWAIVDTQLGESLPSEEEVDKLISGEAIKSDGMRLPLEATAHFPDPGRCEVSGLVRTVARPAAAILRALGPPKGTYTFAHLYAGLPSHQTSLAIVPSTSPPHGHEACTSSSGALRDPGTVQHHRLPTPPQLVHQTDNANSSPLNLVSPPTAALSPPDPVIRFLEELGLSASLADSLRRVGISDDNRIRAIGALPGGPMARIEKGLALEGIDLAACILIRQGLKQRAMHETAGGRHKCR